MLAGALRELGVPNPEKPEFRLSAHDFEGCESRHYQWFKQARLEVYARVETEMSAKESAIVLPAVNPDGEGGLKWLE
jgi:hypothetical protein